MVSFHPPQFCFNNGNWNIPTAPLQKSTKDIPLVVAEEGYKEYAAQFGTSQSLARLNERGGFGGEELAILLFQRIKRMEHDAMATAPAPLFPEPQPKVRH